MTNLEPGADVQQIVLASPPGSTFHFGRGTYRLLEIKPKTGDRFTGEGSLTILSGAVVLSHFDKEGSVFRASYSPPKEQLGGSCGKGSPMCSYPEDCFIDNKPLKRVADVGNLAPGSWFLDYANQQAVIADDPQGHLVEVSTARSAFSGPATDVVISDLIVEKYAVPAQLGAIGDQYPGAQWQVRRCTVRWNHGTGIELVDGSIIAENKVLENGQKGLGARGSNVTIENNEIAFNNYAGFSMGWEAGGTKFARTTNLRVVGNNVHDNLGPGLWTDIDNRQTLYEGNKITDNLGTGIQHEISYSAIIRENFVSGNGRAQSVWLWGSQILIQNSSDVEVVHNNVVVPKGYGNGIGVIIQNRGKWVASNNIVHDNDITYLDRTGVSGVVSDYPDGDHYIATNRFFDNRYHVVDLGRYHWLWKTGYTWETLKQTGQETNSSIDNAVRDPHALPGSDH